MYISGSLTGNARGAVSPLASETYRPSSGSVHGVKKWSILTTILPKIPKLR